MPASRIKVFPHNRSALVEIHRPALVDELKALAEADGFEEKDEFHVTLLPALDVLDDDNRRELEAFQIALHDKLVDDIRIINDAVYRVSKPKVVDGVIYPRESIIARVHSNTILRMLGERMMNGFGIYVPTPFLHTTLFTKGDNAYARRGIGIDTVQEFMQMHPERYPDPDVTL